MVGHHLPPDYLWTLVCTNPQGKRHENLGWLHIPANLPGITIQHMYLMMGIKNAVFFDNVRVPAKYLIGGENNGWKVANTHMELEQDRKSTRLNSSHITISYAVFCLKKKKNRHGTADRHKRCLLPNTATLRSG